ncbi:ribonuclease H-like domain-containing protein [Tanacetum coccineum]
MDPYNHTTPTSTKLPILDTRKFEQWKFRIQQYLQHEHYALWEVIEFGDSYKAPPEEAGKGVVGEGSAKKKGRTLRFSKYDTAKELWEAILKNVGGNEATKKTKKNQLKQQYGNFKAEGSETLEQTFNRLQAIVSHLEFMDVPIEQDDLNQKFLSSLAPEWLVYTIVWRNRDDLDKMSLDDVYNHLKVYEPEVQKSAGSNSQNIAFISSSNTSSGKGAVPTASVPTATTQSNGSQIKYEDITQIDDDDDIEEMDIKWNLALLSMRADRFWKKTGKKITIQGSDVAGFDKSKVECFNCHKMGHFARECRAPRSQDRGKRESYRKDLKVEEPTPKALMALDGIGAIWLMKKKTMHLWQIMKNTENFNTKISKLNEELSDCETDLVLERDVEVRDNKIEYLRNELEEVKKAKESIDHKLEKFENASKDLDSLLGSQRPDKDKKGLGFNEYTAVPPPPAQVYSPPKNDLSWIGLPEFVDDTVTDYTRPTPSVDVSKGVSSELEGDNTSVSKQRRSSGNVVPKPMIRFVNETGCPSISKTKSTEVLRKPTVKYEEMYRNISQSPRVRRNQRNWNNQKSQQLGKEFVMQNKACYNCGSFDHLKFECKQNIWVFKGKTLKSAHPKMTSFETAHSHLKRPFIRKSAVKNKKNWVLTVRTKFPTVGSKVHTAKPTVAADKGNKGKAVKASACLIWKPKQNQSSNLNGVSSIPQENIDDKGYWDNGCSRHMTGNISYLSKYEPYNGGYVSFGHGGGKITGKGTIKTGKLEFENEKTLNW